MEVLAGLVDHREGVGDVLGRTGDVPGRLVETGEVDKVGGRKSLIAHQPQGRDRLLDEGAIRFATGLGRGEVDKTEPRPVGVAVLLADGDDLGPELPRGAVVAEEATEPGGIGLDEGEAGRAEGGPDLPGPPEGLALPA